MLPGTTKTAFPCSSACAAVLSVPLRALASVINTASAMPDTSLFIHQIVNLCPLSNRTSVYRTLNLFATLGIIETITSGWKSRYELAGPFKPHHHHLHCTACRQLIQLDIPILEETIKSFADSHEYMLTGHHIELTGLCKKCQLSLSQGRG